jgi:lipopolysaccharide biosynthesis glycosyltransferase
MRGFIFFVVAPFFMVVSTAFFREKTLEERVVEATKQKKEVRKTPFLDRKQNYLCVAAVADYVHQFIYILREM